MRQDILVDVRSSAREGDCRLITQAVHESQVEDRRTCPPMLAAKMSMSVLCSGS